MKVEDYILVNGYKHILYKREAISEEESLAKSSQFYNW